MVRYAHLRLNGFGEATQDRFDTTTHPESKEPQPGLFCSTYF